MASSFISRTRTSIREIAGEPGAHAKYTDARLLTWIEQAYAHVLGELNRRAKNPLVVRYDLSIVADTALYQLPPIIQRVLDLEVIDSVTGDRTEWLSPRSRYNPAGAGYLLEGHTVYFPEAPSESFTLRIHFMPSGCARLNTGTLANHATAACTFTNATDIGTVTTAHGWLAGQEVVFANSGGALPAELTAGTHYFIYPATSTTFYIYTTQAAAIAQGTKISLSDDGTGTHTVAACNFLLAADQATIILPATPTTGTLDVRKEAYAGSVVRVLTATANNYNQERFVHSYDPSLRAAVLKPYFPTADAPTGTATYEIAPPVAEAIDILIATYVARTIMMIEGDKSRYTLLTQMWREQLRDLSMQVAHFDALRPDMDRGTRFSTGLWVTNRLTDRGRSR